MTKRSRTLLFLTLVSIFFIAAPSIIFYSQGYRFDLETRRLTQVGAFYFDVHPPRAQIFVDGEQIGETSRFIGNNLSKNLLSKTYRVSIQKEGYIPWRKNLDIVPRQVTEAKNITLFPANLVFEQKQQNVLRFWPAPNTRHILLQKENQTELWDLVLWDTADNVEYALFQAETPLQEMGNVEWALNSSALLFQIVSAQGFQTFVQNIDQGMLANASSRADILQIAQDTRVPVPFVNSGAKDIQFFPNDSGSLAFLAPGTNGAPALSVYNVNNGQLQQPPLRNVGAFAFWGQELFWVDTQGNVWRQTSLQAAPVQISQKPFSFTGEEPNKLYAFASQVFLQTENRLYWLNDTSGEFQEIFFRPKEVAISPDAKKLALTSGSEIVLFFLASDSQQPARQKTETVLITRLGQEISHISWLNSHYFAFTAGGKVYATEIDTRDHAQVEPLTDVPHADYFWQPSQERLYIYSTDQIQASQPFWP